MCCTTLRSSTARTSKIWFRTMPEKSIEYERRWGDQRRDGCPNARHLFEPNYVKVWTQKFGQMLSMACGVDFVLFKPLYVKIAFIAMFLIFRHTSQSKLSAKTASEDCMLFFFKSQFLSMTKCRVYLISIGTSTLCKVWVPHSRKSLKPLFY